MRRLLAFLLPLAFAAPAAACLWDYDTLEMERRRFPGALELIVGKFLRHTDGLYEWRIEDRRKDIAAHDSGQKTLADEQLARTYDDLAAALDKLGRHDEAIAAIREKAGRLPNVGEYETHANLGTFLAHSGRSEEGVAELKKAMEINPEAHFGREKYQVLLLEYVMERRGEDGRPKLPLEGSFAWWLLKREGLEDERGNYPDERAAREELDRATKGVLGMMRFGDFRSPILLEALGDVMLSGKNHLDDESSGQRLAARAYLRAAEFADDPKAEAAYRKLAGNALANQIPDTTSGERVGETGQELTLAVVEDQLRREVKEADGWFATTIAYDEPFWIERSSDPDRRFWEKYGEQVVRVGHDRLPAAKFTAAGLPWPIRVALAGAGVATAVGLAVALAWRRRRPTGYGPDDR